MIVCFNDDFLSLKKAKINFAKRRKGMAKKNEKTILKKMTKSLSFKNEYSYKNMTLSLKIQPIYSYVKGYSDQISDDFNKIIYEILPIPNEIQDIGITLDQKIEDSENELLAIRSLFNLFPQLGHVFYFPTKETIKEINQQLKEESRREAINSFLLFLSQEKEVQKLHCAYDKSFLDELKDYANISQDYQIDEKEEKDNKELIQQLLNREKIINYFSNPENAVTNGTLEKIEKKIREFNSCNDEDKYKKNSQQKTLDNYGRYLLKIEGKFVPLLVGIAYCLNKINSKLKQEEDESFLLENELAQPRHFHFILGNTNSGKTHQAIQHIDKNTKGVYLAPLRLLAVENYERLNKKGIPCDLKTGEEEILVENANFCASTIELLDTSKRYDIAIIDEIQMLEDEDRGGQWLRALMNVDAEHIYVLGTHNYFLKIKQLLSNLVYLQTRREVKRQIKDNPYLLSEQNAIEDEKRLFDDIEQHFKQKIKMDVKFTKRFSPLKFIKDKTFSIQDLREGDALIAFSKKKIEYYASILKNRNIPASIIYGDLPIEVRKEQAHLFQEKINKVIVSTDAIGQGLNFNIKRIIFDSCEKFDGKDVRELTLEEVKQIAGRAGRFKEVGEVGVLNNQQTYDSQMGNYYYIKDNKRLFKTFEKIEKELEKERELKEDIFDQTFELKWDEELTDYCKEMVKAYNIKKDFNGEILTSFNYPHFFKCARNLIVDEILNQQENPFDFFEKIKKRKIKDKENVITDTLSEKALHFAIFYQKTQIEAVKRSLEKPTNPLIADYWQKMNFKFWINIKNAILFKLIPIVNKMPISVENKMRLVNPPANILEIENFYRFQYSYRMITEKIVFNDLGKFYTEILKTYPEKSYLVDDLSFSECYYYSPDKTLLDARNGKDKKWALLAWLNRHLHILNAEELSMKRQLFNCLTQIALTKETLKALRRKTNENKPKKKSEEEWKKEIERNLNTINHVEVFLSQKVTEAEKLKNNVENYMMLN